MHHSDPNFNQDQSDEDRDATRTANVLASIDLDTNAPDGDIETAKLGVAIRDSAKRDLPEASESLRAAILDRFDSVDSTPVATASDRSTAKVWRRHVAIIAASAASLLFALSFWSRNAVEQSIVPVAVELNDSNVPYTKQATQHYTVQVPSPDPDAKQYTVTVPYTEQVTQSYMVQVPQAMQQAGQGIAGKTWRAPAKATSNRSGEASPKMFEQASRDFFDVEKFAEMKGKRWDSKDPMAASGTQGRWETQINRAWLEDLPAPKLPGAEARKDGFRFVESHSAEQYEALPENPFVRVDAQPRSTFSIDVDTASYANTRRFLNSGQLPPPNAVRIEEFLNYFQYDYPQPEGDAPFSVNMEVAQCPWKTENKLLRIGIKGKEIQRQKRPASNLVFLLDVSGSMRANDKLPLMKQGLSMMVKHLREDDFVSIVTYAGNAGVLLSSTSGDQVDVITSAIESVQSGGSTNGSAGIDRAYEMAVENFVKDGTNRVILATDGDLNVGITDDQALTQLIQSKAGEGVFLTVLGFGTGNLKDAKMEKLADNGNGNYAYIDSSREAHKVLVKQMSGNLVTIAKDVKLQLEFNPKHVGAYRLIGYENRMLANADFANDKKDAGEIGAGHTVTALYELVSAESLNKQSDDGDSQQEKRPLKYQKTVAGEPNKEIKLSEEGESDELLTLLLRHKNPDANKSVKSEEYVCENTDVDFAKASADFRFAAGVASFGMLLRGSKHAGTATLNSVQKIASGAVGDDVDGNRSEMIDLVRKSIELQQ